MKNKSFIFLLFLSFFARAQDSLLSYLEMADRQNPVVLQKFYEYKAALQRIPQAAIPDPEITLGVFVQPMELVMGNQVAGFQLMQRFPWFGTIQKARDEKSLTAESKFEEFRDTQLQVCFNVVRNWNELQKVNQSILIAKKNVELLRTIENLSLIRWKEKAESANEPTGPADTYRIQIEKSEVENKIALWEEEKAALTVTFNLYLNRRTTLPIELPAVFRKDSLPPSLQHLPDSLSDHPRLIKLLFEQQALDAQKKINKKTGYPSLGVGVNYSLINRRETSASKMNGQDMIMPMLTLSLPVYRKKYHALREETDLMRTASEQNYQGVANELRTAYREAMQEYHHAQQRIKLYAHQRSLAQKTLDIMIKSFSSSGTPLSDILRLCQQLLEYDNKETGAIADHNIAIARIRQLHPSTVK